MDVFDLRDRVIEDYGRYVRSFLTIRDPRIEGLVREAMDGGFLWPDPLIQLNPAFEPGPPLVELDAAFFRLYLGTPAEWRDTGSPALLDAFPTPRDAVDHILETFPIVKRKDIAEHGEYRTKLQVLDIYDAMQRAIDSGEPCRTLLDPPPAHPSVAHPPRRLPTS